jgi:hypothetical protein
MFLPEIKLYYCKKLLALCLSLTDALVKSYHSRESGNPKTCKYLK